jgi:3-hydroxy-3-methylglutaryl CoA synthase
LTELQQKELQSNITSWTPKEKDLSEIRCQEQEIIRLLNEQKNHQQQYEKLHQQQIQQIQEKESKFQQERQVLYTTIIMLISRVLNEQRTGTEFLILSN